MKNIFCVLAVMFCLTASNANAQRIIQSVVITFQTTNDDKDWNSFIRFQLQSADGSWMATQEGTFGTFPGRAAQIDHPSPKQTDHPAFWRSVEVLQVS